MSAYFRNIPDFEYVSRNADTKQISEYQTFNTDGTEIRHPSINIIKKCALTSCNVQYTPNNTYMTYEDPFRTMQAYQLTMQFGELDPIYDDDYAKLDNDQDQVIGY